MERLVTVRFRWDLARASAYGTTIDMERLSYKFRERKKLGIMLLRTNGNMLLALHAVEP